MRIILPFSALAVSPMPTNRVTSRLELSSCTPACRVDGAPHIARQGDRCTSDYGDSPPNRKRHQITDIGAYRGPLALLPAGPIKLASRLSRADAKPKQDSPSDGKSLPHSERVHVRDVAVAAC